MFSESHLLCEAVCVTRTGDVHDVRDAVALLVDVVHGVSVLHVGDVTLVEEQDVRTCAQRHVKIRVPPRERDLSKCSIK